MAINGPDFLLITVCQRYTLYPVISGASYSWALPGNAEATSGQNTASVLANWNILAEKLKPRYNQIQIPITWNIRLMFPIIS